MKKLVTGFIFIFLGLLSVQTFGQKFGIQGGINLSKLLVKDNDDTYSEEFKSNMGFNAGVTLGFGLTNLIDFEVGAIVESRGFKMEVEGDSWKSKLLYADIPVLLKVGPTLGPVKIFAAAGPYLGFGLTGKDVYNIGGQEESEDIKWGNNADEDDFKRLDFGGKFGIGAEAMHFTLGAYYTLGMANISADTENGQKVQQRGISIFVGYTF
jgi:hypothetical protein